MELKYLSYSLEELLEDQLFVAWVLRKQNNDEWKEFIDANPQFRHTTIKAREIILMLRDSYELMDEDSVLEIWQNIDRLEKLHNRKGKKVMLRKTLQWAASVLLILSLGMLGYFYLNDKDSEYQFTSIQNEPDNNKSRLVLSDGEEVTLAKDNSSVAFNNENELVIDNDSTIDLNPREPATGKELRLNEVIIPYGKRSEILLADGTKVWLNAGSRLAFPSKFNGKNREVFLEGEACFKVTENKKQPFIVNAGELNVEVLGTWFNVSAYQEDQVIETVLLEGSVSVQKPSVLGIGLKETVLKPNQKASFNKKLKDIVVQYDPDADIVISWTEGWFQFSGESLKSVLNKLERYYNIEVVLPEHFPSTERITGKLDLKDSPQEVLQALADVAKISYRVSEDKIYIDKKIEEMK